MHVITSVKFCLDFGNDECIIMGNFRARIASAFEVIETPPPDHTEHKKNLGLNRVKQRA